MPRRIFLPPVWTPMRPHASTMVHLLLRTFFLQSHRENFCRGFSWENAIRDWFQRRSLGLTLSFYFLVCGSTLSGCLRLLSTGSMRRMRPTLLAGI
ncbi:hypothetical protein R1flu_011848 [Riccia fluitans]|uniref:Secreted protein n=1 Tax=Riccia fluitans TaxID=41844 RepID=A0ABD1Z8Y5_9MARC